MEFRQSSEEFKRLLSRIKPCQMDQFLIWTKKTVTDLLDKAQSEDNSTVMLNSIREDIRGTLPLEAVTQTETIQCPTSGPNADCDPRSTVHVDAFLYDDDAIDELCDEGKMSRNYCTQCLSRAVKPLTFISHSASVKQILFIYQYLLTDLRGKMLLDVGSRTGAVLYGAHLYSEAERIIGVELDPTFCDVIILNNVFEFFMPPEQQINIWQFLYRTVRKKNSVLITIPSIEESLENLQTSFDLSAWLQPVDIASLKDSANLRYFSSTEESDLNDIFMYQVL